MQTLDLQWTLVKEVDALANKKGCGASLTDLNLYYSKGEDVSPLAACISLRSLALKGAPAFTNGSADALDEAVASGCLTIT